MSKDSEKTADQWCDEGNLLGGKGQYEEALKCLDKALELDPEHALSWFNKGLTLMNMRRKPEAVTAFETFIKHAPPEAHNMHVPTAEMYIQMMKGGGGPGVIQMTL